MKRHDLIFDRPAELAATAPAEARGISRDEARLLVSSPNGHTHAHFFDLPQFLNPGDVLVVNQSATLAASLPAYGSVGDFILNVATNYGGGLWLAEPRWSSSEPGPLPLRSGEIIHAGGVECRLISTFPGLPRLWFVQANGDLTTAMEQSGTPIRYGYINQAHPLSVYQTIFSTVPGSAEMPSAAYPFTRRVVDDLRVKGVELAGIVLHTGVSSLEVETEIVEDHPLYAEPFRVPRQTAQIVNRALSEGRRVIAVGTTVVRALETAWDGAGVRPMEGFTRIYIHPQRGVNVVNGLITGLHDPVTSHLAMLYAIAGQETIRSAYDEAARESYHWHEFGDSHLILADEIMPALLETAELATA
jgi:S-adenosylmethionine:tRNA ribosyltransferase-isomerase